MADELQDEEIKVYDACLKVAIKEAWWNEFVRITRARRVRFMETLATAEDLTQRTEDRIRGQISETNFVLALNAYAQTQYNKKGGESNG